MKRPHQILSRSKIHASLAANRCINLRHHCGGNLYQLHAAHVERRQQAGNVADDSSTESDQNGISVRAQAGKLLGQNLDGCQLLVDLAVGHLDDLGGETGIAQ